VTSNVPHNSCGPERKPGKKYSHVGDLKSKVSGEELEVYYELLSPFPKGAWPSNRQFRYYRRNSIDEVVGSKSKKKCKGKKNKCYLHGGHRDESFEALDEYGSFDGCDDDVSIMLAIRLKFNLLNHLSGPDTPYFIILLCLMPDNFSYQGESAATP
jgi:hypothetical protein